jgi:hypothetical protein
MKKLILTLSFVLAGCGGGGTTNTSGTIPVAVNVPSAPTCTLKAYDTNYPKEFLGTNVIPTPTQKFDSNIVRSIGLKDYYPFGDNNYCSSKIEYTRALYKKTLDKLQELNANVVEIYQYGPIDDFKSATWTMNQANWQIPKSELVWFVQEAHSRNIKVTLVWQLWPTDSKNNYISSYTNTTDITNLTNKLMPEGDMIRILRGWHNIIMEMAKLATENKIDNLYIQWSAFYFPVVTLYKESATLEFLSIINDIRTIYNGKIFMGIPLFYDKRIIDKVDAISIPINNPTIWSYNDSLNISVSLLKQRYMDTIVGQYIPFSLYSGVETKSIPVIWDVGIQSRDNFLSEGWREDGFCVKPNNNGPVSYNDPLCIQKNYKTDFSIQALAYEGLFQAIKEQPYFKTYGINLSTSYWHTDTLVPGEEGFPNLSQSIRGKPAENIVKHWFSKI